MVIIEAAQKKAFGSFTYRDSFARLFGELALHPFLPPNEMG
jgi:hypothetical protein